MLRLISGAIFLSFSFTLMACGGSGNGIRGASLCNKDYTERNLKIDLNNQGKKTKIEPDKELNLPQGEFALSKVEFYIDDPDREIRMHVALTPATKENENPKVELLCIGGTLGSDNPAKGISRKMDPFTFTLPVAGQVLVDQDNKSTLSMGTVTFDYRFRAGQSNLVGTYEVDDKAVSGSLKDVYLQFEEVSQYLYEFPSSLEVRSAFKMAKGSERNSSSTNQSLTGVLRFQ